MLYIALSGIKRLCVQLNNTGGSAELMVIAVMLGHTHLLTAVTPLTTSPLLIAGDDTSSHTDIMV